MNPAPRVLLALAWILCAANVHARQPNFIIIFCDDLGYADIGPFGSELHRTPNIDQMATEGMRLTNFYSTCCVCTPSRSSLMTGCYPKRVGLHESEKGQWVLFPGNQRGISSEETTIAEVLKEQGYATAIVGKWHLGDKKEFLPTRHGFDSYFGIPFSNDMGKMDRAIETWPPTPLLRDEVVVEMEPDQRYITRRYTDEALKFIEDNQQRPFFLYLPHSMPHWPQYASTKYANKSANGPWGDAVEEIDASTGEIFAKLKELGLDEDTLVIFTSDNGGATHHGAVNKPLRGGKGTTWEGGQRVCCVARWPGKIAAGSQCDQLAVTFDLLPTLAKLAGGEAPADRKLDGKDIAPLLMEADAKSPHESFFYFFRGNLNAVRADNWKLFVKRKPGRRTPAKLEKPELYDLSQDIGETTNVADEHPDVVARLMDQLEAMRGDLGDGDEREATGARPAGWVDYTDTLTMDPPDELVQTDVFVSGGSRISHLPNTRARYSCQWRPACRLRGPARTVRSDHGDLDLVMKRSSDQGKTWGDLQLIYEEGGSAKVHHRQPLPSRRPDNRSPVDAVLPRQR